MIKKIADFAGFQVGDLVSLSDLQTQAEYNKLSVDFPIREVRTYSEPNGVFKYYGYVVEAPNAAHDLYLLLIKTMKEAFEAYVFFKDIGASGPVYAAPTSQPQCPLLAFFDEAGKDFVARFEAQVTDASGKHAVTWDRQTSSYGVNFESTTDGEGICSLGEYYTNDENGGNNYCLMDWKGDTVKGYVETWYGCMVKNSEVELFHK
jgi:hypothetical protein